MIGLLADHDRDPCRVGSRDLLARDGPSTTPRRPARLSAASPTSAGPPRTAGAVADGWSPLRSLLTASLPEVGSKASWPSMAEWMPGRGENGANPRFVVTLLKAREYEAQRLYEQLYCARGSPPRPADRVSFGDRIAALLLRDGKPHQGVPARPLRRPHAARCVGWLDTCQEHARQSKARRPSIRFPKGTRPAGRGGQLRLWLASMAYVLLTALRRIGLAHAPSSMPGPPAAPSASGC